MFSTETLPAVLPATEMIADVGYFESVQMFEAGQRMAQVFASSSLVPDNFAIQNKKVVKDQYGKIIREEPFTKEEFENEKRSKIGTCLIALDMAMRLKANPIAVMQNIYIVHNKPSWSSQFLIACINKSGSFKTPLRYRFSGTEGKDDYGCVAWAVDNSGEILESTKITLGMAKSEGWTSKNGSKWKTMPEQMLRYRSATFFARAYCPELTMGMMTNDEVRDVYDGTEPRAKVTEMNGYIPNKSAAASKLDAILGLDKKEAAPAAEVIDVESETDDDEFPFKD